MVRAVWPNRSAKVLGFHCTTRPVVSVVKLVLLTPKRALGGSPCGSKDEPLQCVTHGCETREEQKPALVRTVVDHWSFSGRVLVEHWSRNGERILSDEQEAPPLTGRAKGWANIKPWKKGQSGNKSGKLKDLARFGDILMKEFYKTVTASLGGKTVGETQGEIVAMAHLDLQVP